MFLIAVPTKQVFDSTTTRSSVVSIERGYNFTHTVNVLLNPPPLINPPPPPLFFPASPRPKPLLRLSEAQTQSLLGSTLKSPSAFLWILCGNFTKNISLKLHLLIKNSHTPFFPACPTPLEAQ